MDGAADMLSAAEWMALLRDVGIVRECNVRQLYLIFAQSRMTTVVESSRRTGQLTQLTFEGFCEAMVRLAFLKALPTDKELARHSFQYPAEYIAAVLDRGAAMYDAWVLSSKRCQREGKADPIYRRVDMLVLLFVGVMQYGVEVQHGGPSVLLRGHPDEVLSLEEVKRYWKKPTRAVFEVDN